MYKRNSSAKKNKNGTVVRKHTVPFFVLLWMNETVVQKWNSGTKTRNSGTLFRFRSVEVKTEQLCNKRNSGTKTHCSVFVPLWKNGTVQKRNSGTKTRLLDRVNSTKRRYSENQYREITTRG